MVTIISVFYNTVTFKLFVATHTATVFWADYYRNTEMLTLVYKIRNYIISCIIFSYIEKIITDYQRGSII
jgi:hypothetical protein